MNESNRTSNPLDTLLQRLKDDGGRYLLSVALTAGQYAEQEPATFGGKSWKRWLTDPEYKELVALLECGQFAKPLSCETHGLVPDCAAFEHKCPACEIEQLQKQRDGYRGAVERLNGLLDRQRKPERPTAWWRYGPPGGEPIVAFGNWPPPEPDDTPWYPLYSTPEGRPADETSAVRGEPL